MSQKASDTNSPLLKAKIGAYTQNFRVDSDFSTLYGPKNAILNV
jgi:hypothetical protein